MLQFRKESFQLSQPLQLPPDRGSPPHEAEGRCHGKVRLQLHGVNPVKDTYIFKSSLLLLLTRSTFKMSLLCLGMIGQLANLIYLWTVQGNIIYSDILNVERVKIMDGRIVHPRKRRSFDPPKASRRLGLGLPSGTSTVLYSYLRKRETAHRTCTTVLEYEFVLVILLSVLPFLS